MNEFLGFDVFCVVPLHGNPGKKKTLQTNLFYYLYRLFVFLFFCLLMQRSDFWFCFIELRSRLFFFFVLFLFFLLEWEGFGRRRFVRKLGVL